jgi:hypothetical protein
MPMAPIGGGNFSASLSVKAMRGTVPKKREKELYFHPSDLTL